MQILRIAIFCFSAVLTSLVNAQSSDPSAIIFNSELKPDIRVVIDISGSMKLNDPNNLRRPALELLVQLFPEGSKAGVWTFGQWVNNLVPSKNVQQAWRESALLQAKKINSVALYTNIPLALEQAVSDIDSLDLLYDVQLILLTDGMVDISKSAADNDRARERVINDLLPKLRKAGVTIHTVALSKNADQELMERLAVETGGLAAVAETADDLARIFLQAFDAAAPAEQLPLDGGTFIVDSTIEEFSALLFRKSEAASVQLIAPDGTRHSIDDQDASVNWFRQDNYDLITIKSPMAGEWAIDAELEPDSRVTIVSHLNLKVSPLKKGSFTDDSRQLLALLAEAETTIVKPEFLNLVDMSVDVQRREDSQSWHISLSGSDPIPESGVFQSAIEMTNTVGVYDVTVKAIGKTFSRQHKQTIAVREPFDIRVSSSHDNPLIHTVNLFARNPEIDFNSTEVSANVTLVDGSVKSMPVVETAERRWKLIIDSGLQPAAYSVNFELKGQLFDGQSFNKRTPSVQITPVDTGAEPVVAAPEPEPQVEEALTVAEDAQPVMLPEPKPTMEEATDKRIDWAKIATYVGVGLANLLVIGLGYWVYKVVTGTATRSEVLESSDDVEIEDGLMDTDEGPVAPVLVADVEVGDDSDAAPESATGPKLDTLDDFDLGGGEELDLDESLEFSESIDVDKSDMAEVDELDLDMGDDEAAATSMVDIDDIDDFLDLPEDAIDIDPSKDKG
ncbi:MAG: vWA domain-containing protein [Spongiibacteraceae bacterium]